MIIIYLIFITVIYNQLNNPPYFHDLWINRPCITITLVFSLRVPLRKCSPLEIGENNITVKDILLNICLLVEKRDVYTINQREYYKWGPGYM